MNTIYLNVNHFFFNIMLKIINSINEKIGKKGNINTFFSVYLHICNCQLIC